MKKLCIAVAAGAALWLSGCFSVDTAPVMGGGEHVVMNNYGWKFFNWIPLVCGNVSENASFGTAIFRDDVTVEKIQKRFTGYAKGRMIECPVYDVNDTVFMTIFGIPIPYIITYREITLSGTLK
ncbi:MAG: hypothetical protein J6T01_03255 [Kiritimatiellae bacterium]|nr:hypothetical protein [Kiritimatiellia bacterium]